MVIPYSGYKAITCTFKSSYGRTAAMCTPNLSPPFEPRKVEQLCFDRGAAAALDSLSRSGASMSAFLPCGR